MFFLYQLFIRINFSNLNEDLNIKYNNFINLSINSHGGAIYSEISKKVIISYCSFISCNTENIFYGGAIYSLNSNHFLISFCNGCKCFSGHGQFLYSHITSNSNSTLYLNSWIKCPENFEGNHQSLYFENEYVDVEFINISNCKMKGHSLLISINVKYFNIKYSTFSNSITGAILENFNCISGIYSNINIINNSPGIENIGIFHFRIQGNFENNNIYLFFNYFSKEVDNKESSFMNTIGFIRNSITVQFLTYNSFLCKTILDYSYIKFKINLNIINLLLFLFISF